VPNTSVNPARGTGPSLALLVGGHGRAPGQRRMFRVAPIIGAVVGALLLIQPSPALAGYREGIDALNRGDHAAALAELKPLAMAGDAKAQWALGYMYRLGLGVPKDPARAKEWERRAARTVVGEAPRDKVSPQVLRIPAGPAASSGTGWLAAAAKVVTNHHVVAGCRALRVQTSRGPTGARLAGFDPTNDLALLDVPALAKAKPATLRTGSRPVQLGEAVMFTGFPLRAFVSDEMHVSTGIVSALAGPKGDQRFIQLGAAVQPGDSGGPLMDKSGLVIGVVSGTLNPAAVERATGLPPQNVGFAIRGERLQGFLKKLDVSYRTGTTDARADSAQLAQQAQSFTVLVECIK